MKSNLYFLVALFQTTDISGKWMQTSACISVWQMGPYMGTGSGNEVLSEYAHTNTFPYEPLTPHQSSPSFFSPTSPPSPHENLNQEAEETKDDFHASQAPNTCEASWWGWSGRSLAHRNGGTREPNPQGPVLLTSSSTSHRRSRWSTSPFLKIIWDTVLKLHILKSWYSFRHSLNKDFLDPWSEP